MHDRDIIPSHDAEAQDKHQTEVNGADEETYTVVGPLPLQSMPKPRPALNALGWRRVGLDAWPSPR